MFFYEVEGHMLKLSSFGRGKKIRPKKSLTSFLHEALQVIYDGDQVTVILFFEVYNFHPLLCLF